MPATKSQRKPAARKPAARKPAAKRRPAARSRATDQRQDRVATAVGRTTELTDEMLHSVESGQRAAIEAVHKFVDRVDHTLAGDGAKATRRQEILDAALEMSDRLVHTEYDFLRRVVDGAAESLTSKKAGRK